MRRKNKNYNYKLMKDNWCFVFPPQGKEQAGDAAAPEKQNVTFDVSWNPDEKKKKVEKKMVWNPTKGKYELDRSWTKMRDANFWGLDGNSNK